MLYSAILVDGDSFAVRQYCFHKARNEQRKNSITSSPHCKETKRLCKAKCQERDTPRLAARILLTIESSQLRKRDDGIRVGIVFQEYVFDRDETHLSPFKCGCENNGEVKRLSQVIYAMCADSSFDTCRYLTMKDSQRPVVPPRNFTPPRCKAHCARRSRSLMIFFLNNRSLSRCSIHCSTVRVHCLCDALR